MLRRAMTTVLERSGYELRRAGHPDRAEATHPDLDRDFFPLYRRAAPYTMTSIERMYALYQAVRHVAAAGMDGDIVECGVWRGGSSLLAALTLEKIGERGRTLWLYDTFEGMSEPTERDVAIDGERMADVWDAHRGDQRSRLLCYSTLERVQATMAEAGTIDDVRFVKGKVEQTIPREIPERIAVLRLDTDWYESTRHELEHLFPRLAPGGVLIIDDYGHWEGARQAVDEYFTEHGVSILLSRIDYTGRIGVKPA